MVVNNWFVITDGLAAVLGKWYRVAWVFSVLFYMLIHIVILNVLVTSVVENFERMVDETDRSGSAMASVVSEDQEESNAAPMAHRILGEDDLITQGSSRLDDIAGGLVSNDWILDVLAGHPPA